MQPADMFRFLTIAALADDKLAYEEKVMLVRVAGELQLQIDETLEILHELTRTKERKVKIPKDPDVQAMLFERLADRVAADHEVDAKERKLIRRVAPKLGQTEAQIEAVLARSLEKAKADAPDAEQVPTRLRMFRRFARTTVEAGAIPEEVRPLLDHWADHLEIDPNDAQWILDGVAKSKLEALQAGDSLEARVFFFSLVEATALLDGERAELAWDLLREAAPRFEFSLERFASR